VYRTLVNVTAPPRVRASAVHPLETVLISRVGLRVVFKAHRLVHHSTLGVRVIKKKRLRVRLTGEKTRQSIYGLGCGVWGVGFGGSGPTAHASHAVQFAVWSPICSAGANTPTCIRVWHSGFDLVCVIYKRIIHVG